MDYVLEIVWLARKWSFGVVNFVFIVKGQSCGGRLEDVEVLCWQPNEYVGNKVVLWVMGWWNGYCQSDELSWLSAEGIEKLAGCGMNCLLTVWGTVLTFNWGGFEELEACGINWLLPVWGTVVTFNWGDLSNWKLVELTVFCMFEVLSTFLPGGTEEHHEGQPVSWPIFEPRHSWLRRVNTPLDRDLMSTGRN